MPGREVQRVFYPHIDTVKEGFSCPWFIDPSSAGLTNPTMWQPQHESEVLLGKHQRENHLFGEVDVWKYGGEGSPNTAEEPSNTRDKQKHIEEGLHNMCLLWSSPFQWTALLRRETKGEELRTSTCSTSSAWEFCSPYITGIYLCSRVKEVRGDLQHVSYGFNKLFIHGRIEIEIGVLRRLGNFLQK